ncbi:hypothetical protein [Deinococcus aquaticus]
MFDHVQTAGFGAGHALARGLQQGVPARRSGRLVTVELGQGGPQRLL